VSGISGIVVQILLYAPIAERIGSVWTFRMGAVFSVPILFFFYFLNLIQPIREEHPAAFWAIFGFVFSLRGAIPVFQFTSYVLVVRA
jgi:hypothetical protein